jgi:hypothetical protein
MSVKTQEVILALKNPAKGLCDYKLNINLYDTNYIISK